MPGATDNPPPDWFTLGEGINERTMSRMADALSGLDMDVDVRSQPMLAHWFLRDSLALSNQANREGSHANALVLTRQCVEAISIIELGLSGHPQAPERLRDWQMDRLTPGGLRQWLSTEVWPAYGTGIWDEPWSAFMAEFARAIQPYAHYTSQLAQWQVRLHGVQVTEGGGYHGVIEMAPRAYDAQKATRITLFHIIITFLLARVWAARLGPTDQEFVRDLTGLQRAIGKSRYLDGHKTNWSQQFWMLVWNKDGSTILE